MRLDPDAVMSVALDWVYVPDGAPEVRTEEFHLVVFPQTWPLPAGVFRIHSARPAADVVDDVMAAAGSLGRRDVTFWTHPGVRPDDLVAELTARGATLAEQMGVLALALDDLADLDEAAPFLAAPEIRTADDLDTLRDFERITASVFGGPVSSDHDLTRELTVNTLATGLGWVAYRDGLAVACAAATVRGDVVRLWGAATLPEARGTGAYRALLAHRLRVATAAGCSMALVTGRLETSAPILRRAGFVQCGEETTYRLQLA